MSVNKQKKMVAILRSLHHCHRFKSYVALAIVTRNLHRIGTVLQKCIQRRNKKLWKLQYTSKLAA